MFIDRAAIGRATELISEYKIKPVLLKRASGHTLEDQEFLIHTSRRKCQRNMQDDEQADQLPNKLFLCFQRPHEITCSLFFTLLALKQQRTGGLLAGWENKKAKVPVAFSLSFKQHRSVSSQ